MKAGGSAVTDKKKERTPRLDVIEKMAEQLKGENVILVHGGGSFGHPFARKFELHHGFTDKSQIEGVVKTRLCMTELNTLIVTTLMKRGVPAVSVQTSACFVCTNTRVSSCFIDSVERLLQIGCLPVLYGDVVCDTKMGFCILSGDQIVSYLGIHLHPERVIFGMDVEGLFTADPKQGQADLIREITYDDLQQISGGETGDVTRGMKGKLQEIERLRGIEVDLINLTRDMTLKKALQGDVEGTRVK